MSWGKDIEYLEGLQSEGVEVPALLVRPKLTMRQAWFMEIFEDISSSRQYSMSGPLPVPISEIKSYCEFFELEGLDLRGRIFRLVRALDFAYLRISKDRQDADQADREKEAAKKAEAEHH